MGKKLNLSRFIAVGMILIIIGVVIGFLFIRSEKEKNTDGELVTCTITSVSKIGKNRTAEGYYIDDDGNKITVEIINTVMPAVGADEEGYILPDDPDKVILKTPVWLLCLAMGLSLLFVGGGAALIVGGIKYTADQKLLALEGELTQGRIVGIHRDGSDRVVFYIAKVVYTDSNGTEHTFEDTSDANKYRHAGDTVNVRYARKKNGKYANEIV
ncbi:MAG: DUF3592 domain-containing protein [Ruminococcus sp.]|nr:DUF3592 domain-containing protein [Ruminococcus sp.]